MTVQRLDHIGIVVGDLDAATAFLRGARAHVGRRGRRRGRDVRGPEGIIVELAQRLG